MRFNPKYVERVVVFAIFAGLGYVMYIERQFDETHPCIRWERVKFDAPQCLERR